MMITITTTDPVEASGYRGWNDAASGERNRAQYDPHPDAYQQGWVDYWDSRYETANDI